MLGPFVVVAGKTSERKVLRFVRPVMFTGDNMIELKGQQSILLCHPAILADRPARCHT
jgi:hypothetical protein